MPRSKPVPLSVRTLPLAVLVTATAAIFAVLGGASARADSLVYVDGSGNIATARPDGGGAHRVTNFAGDAAKPQAISVDDQGGIASFRRVPGESAFLTVTGPDGRLRNGPYLFDLPICGSISPFRGASTPDGVFVAATYVHGNNCASSGFQVRTRLVSGRGPTTGDIYGSYPDLVEPRWLRHPQVLLAGITEDVIQVWQSPEVPTMESWITLDDTASWDIDSFDVHPTQNRILIEQSPEGNPDGGERRDILLASYTGTPGPTSVPSGICALDGLVASSQLRARPRFSPDGSRIAWNAPAGVYVSPAPTPGPGDVCRLSPKLVLPGASEVEWSRLDVKATPGGGGKPKLIGVGGANRAGFRKGLVLKVDAPAAGRVKAIATVAKGVAKRLGLARRPRGPVTVASGVKAAKAAGPLTIKLRPTAKAKSRWRKLAGVKLEIRLAQAGSSTVKKVKLKR